MQVVSITEGRKQLGELVNIVKYQNRVIALGKNGKADVLMVAMPELESDVPVSGMNADSASFRFLEDEPDLYSVADVKVTYD
jgi:hypothetical protein